MSFQFKSSKINRKNEKILILVLFNRIYTKIGVSIGTTRKPFRTIRDVFRHRVNISESMDIVLRAAFAIVLFYFPERFESYLIAGRASILNINGAHKPWRIHLRMSRDELFFSSWPVPPLFTVFYFEFRASHHGTNDFSRTLQIIIYHDYFLDRTLDRIIVNWFYSRKWVCWVSTYLPRSSVRRPFLYCHLKKKR